MNKVLALLALAVLIAFVGILIWKVPEPDLIAVAVLTVTLTVTDFLVGLRRKR